MNKTITLPIEKNLKVRCDELKFDYEVQKLWDEGLRTPERIAIRHANRHQLCGGGHLRECVIASLRRLKLV